MVLVRNVFPNIYQPLCKFSVLLFQNQIYFEIYFSRMFDFVSVEGETHQTAWAGLFSHATIGHTL